MALATKERVSIPEHCVKVHKGDHVYIQYTVRAYRNSKGKPTSERVCIGKLDPETNMLIPNTRYYELFEKRQPIHPQRTGKVFRFIRSFKKAFSGVYG